MLYGAKIMAETAVELITKPELLEQAKEEHRKGTGGKPYVCPIPDGVPVPQPSNG